MNILQKRRERINYSENSDERKRLTISLRSGYFQKGSLPLPELPGSLRAKVILCISAGIFLLIGCLFILI